MDNVLKTCIYVLNKVNKNFLKNNFVFMFKKKVNKKFFKNNLFK